MATRRLRHEGTNGPCLRAAAALARAAGDPAAVRADALRGFGGASPVATTAGPRTAWPSKGVDEAKRRQDLDPTSWRTACSDECHHLAGRLRYGLPMRRDFGRRAARSRSEPPSRSYAIGRASPIRSLGLARLLRQVATPATGHLDRALGPLAPRGASGRDGEQPVNAKIHGLSVTSRWRQR